MEDLFTLPEFAATYRVPEGTARYWRHIGEGGPPSFKIGRRVMYRVRDCERWFDAQVAAAIGGTP